MNRRSFVQLLWCAVFSLFLRSPRVEPVPDEELDGVPWELAEQYKLGPSTDLVDPNRGFIVREFYAGRGDDPSYIIVRHLDAEVMVSGYVDGGVPKPSLFSRFRRWLLPSREVRGPGAIRRV